MVSHKLPISEQNHLHRKHQHNVIKNMPIEALISPVDSSVMADSTPNGTAQKNTFIKLKKVTKRVPKLPASEEKNCIKITNYFIPRPSKLTNGFHEPATPVNNQNEISNGDVGKTICTRSQNCTATSLNGHAEGHYLRQRTPSPTKTPTPTSSPRSDPPTPHKIQALNENKLRIELPLSSESNFGKLTITSQPATKFPKKSTKAKKARSNPPTLSVVGAKTTVPKASKAQTNGVAKAEAKPPVKCANIGAFFPIRRSHRKPKATIMMEKQKEIEDRILFNKEEGLMIKDFGAKGRGVVTTRKFNKGDMVIEYIGDLITTKVAKERELMYAKDNSKGCYMYYFTHQNTQYCIDATEESGYLGRLVNHSKTSSNLITKTVEVNRIPHLILMAKRDIEAGTEVLYDYGDRSKEALRHHPWLAL